MRHMRSSLAVGLALVPALWALVARGSPPASDSPKAVDGGSSCGKYGTSVEFVGTPSEAARQAKEAEKLVFVLHVSGHFEDPRFT